LKEYTMSIAKDSLKFCSMFEGELLTELLLRYWHHPLADNEEFRRDIIETAAKALRASIDGKNLIEGLPPEDMSFIAAVWYAEWSNLQNAYNNEDIKPIFQQREDWLLALRHAVPSCFCDPKNLPE
jgi:hypothetical protein